MKTRVIAMLALAGAGAWAGGDHPEHTVLVCTTMHHDFTVEKAEIIAIAIFDRIGVQLEWHANRTCPAEAIRISFSDRAPSHLAPAALAYAFPYEASHIEVFTDRLGQHPAALQPVLLGHVMAHEITHILQGTAWHSPSGIMMARWTRHEIDQMAIEPLGFTDFDVRLIRRGLEARESRQIAARSALP